MSIYDDLADIASQFANSDFRGCHFAPTSWERGASSKAFPFPHDYEWSTLSQILTSANDGSIMCLAPLLWQLDSLVHTCAQERQRPIISVSAENPLLAKAYFEQLPISVLVTTPELLETLYENLASQLASLSKILLIRAVHTSVNLSNQVKNLPIIDEVHLVPGLWIATRNYNEAAFSLNKTLEWKLDDEETKIALELPDGSLSKYITLECNFTTTDNKLYSIHV